jgi:hypothetical protein
LLWGEMHAVLQKWLHRVSRDPLKRDSCDQQRLWRCILRMGER